MPRQQIVADRDGVVLRDLLLLPERFVVRVEEQLVFHDGTANAAAELVAVEVADGQARLLVEVGGLGKVGVAVVFVRVSLGARWCPMG